MIIDSHCHLDMSDYGEEIDEVVKRAQNAGIGLILTVATTPEEYEKALEIAKKYPFIYAAFGIHPEIAGSGYQITVDELVRKLNAPKLIAVGETGLDYFYGADTKQAQKELLRIHCTAARQVGKPIIIHTRDADDDLIEIIEDELKKGSFKGVIHCFSSGDKLAQKALEWGFYISFSGILTFKKALELQEMAKKIPLERLLVETDAPFLAPVPYRGKRNEPAYVVETFKKLAELKGVEEGVLASQIENNFRELFNL